MNPIVYMVASCNEFIVMALLCELPCVSHAPVTKVPRATPIYADVTAAEHYPNPGTTVGIHENVGYHIAIMQNYPAKWNMACMTVIRATGA